jgi:hypothetical protein
VVVNTLGLGLDERPSFFAELMPGLSGLRAKNGRPHWLVIDEAHHLLPKARDGASLALAKDVSGVVFITVHPDEVSPDALRAVTVVLALGPQAHEVIETFCDSVGETVPRGEAKLREKDEVLYWRRGALNQVRSIAANRPKQSHKRHTRKYAEGALKDDECFYFRGPKGKTNLKAQNLTMFVHIAAGIDDETWEHHRRAGNYSRWFRDMIKDPELAAEAEVGEHDRTLGPAESRKWIADAIHKRYTAPASEKKR